MTEQMTAAEFAEKVAVALAQGKRAMDQLGWTHSDTDVTEELAELGRRANGYDMRVADEKQEAPLPDDYWETAQ